MLDCGTDNVLRLTAEAGRDLAGELFGILGDLQHGDFLETRSWIVYSERRKQAIVMRDGFVVSGRAFEIAVVSPENGRLCDTDAIVLDSVKRWVLAMLAGLARCAWLRSRPEGRF